MSSYFLFLYLYLAQAFHIKKQLGSVDVNASRKPSKASGMNSSRMSSARSSKSVDQNSGLESSSIQNPLALLAVEPATGVIGPRETQSVILQCAAGGLPQVVFFN